MRNESFLSRYGWTIFMCLAIPLWVYAAFKDDPVVNPRLKNPIDTVYTADSAYVTITVIDTVFKVKEKESDYYAKENP